MPLISIEKIETDVTLGLWQITESVDEFLKLNPNLDFAYNSISLYRSEARKRESLAIYTLLYKLTGNSKLQIEHNSNGKPIVDGLNVSISHTKGYAALIISKTKNVAVDIEYVSSRISKIVDKFIRKDEDASCLEYQLINWSTKEAVYKFYSEQNLQYFEMRLKPYDMRPYGIIEVENLKKEFLTHVNYRINKYYVLTYMND